MFIIYVLILCVVLAMSEYICQYYYILTLKKYRCGYYYTLLSKNNYVSILYINMGKYMLKTSGAQVKAFSQSLTSQVTLATGVRKMPGKPGIQPIINKSSDTGHR